MARAYYASNDRCHISTQYSLAKLSKSQVNYVLLIIWLAIVGGVIKTSSLDTSGLSYYTSELVHKDCIVNIIPTEELNEYIALLKYQDREEIIMIPITIEELELLNSSKHSELYKDLILYRSDDKSKEMVTLGKSLDARALGLIILSMVGVIFVLIAGSNSRY